MSHYPRYRKYYPKLYRPRVPIFWWVHKRAHVRFILRELTSVFVAYTALLLLLLVHAAKGGAASYEAFLDWLASPWVVVPHVVALAMLVFHSVTWFNLAPKAMVVEVGGRRVPGVLIAGANFAAWAVLSAGLAWIILG